MDRAVDKKNEKYIYIFIENVQLDPIWRRVSLVEDHSRDILNKLKVRPQNTGR
jgi:hypothetical protein